MAGLTCRRRRSIVLIEARKTGCDTHSSRGGEKIRLMTCKTITRLFTAGSTQLEALYDEGDLLLH